ncbi:hypothetical protein [Actinomyces faecalis]|uniref:hypothetical protein n=1 Tax=Actinomyces faecalis TaxID=2722820 RepID=UPI001556C91B|nr:hypothetical protein [Actinomyces faecalis]
MSQEQVVSDLTTEVTIMVRAGAQMGRYMADARREALRRAQATDLAKVRALREAMERERRLAEPVVRQASQAGFWEQASQEDGAYVYAVACRFATIDPAAALAARTCEREMAERWGVQVAVGDSTRAQAHPVDSSELEPRRLEAVVPALPGEVRDWAGVLDASAQADRAEARAVAAGDSSVQAAREEESSRAQLRQVLEDWPQVARVEVSTTQAYVEDTGEVITVADFTAVDGEGARVEGASKALNDAADESWEPSVFVARMAGRSYSRDDFGVELGRPVMVAAGQPAPQGSPRVARWDSAEARQAWAQQRRAAGIDPVAVRAAVTGDMALSQPATRATVVARAKPTGGRAPVQQAVASRVSTLTA